MICNTRTISDWGYFDTLYNIGLPADHPLAINADELPEKISPLCLKLSNVVNINKGALSQVRVSRDYTKIAFHYTYLAQSAWSSGIPYNFWSASQPKSAHQQFSACGTCHIHRFMPLYFSHFHGGSLLINMTRVCCDLKDLPIEFVGPPSTCLNCKEWGIKCMSVLI